MPTYHIEIVGVVADADQKWVDNVISRFPVHGVERATHGVSRRISTAAIRQIALARQLVTTLGVRVGAAVTLANDLLTSQHGSVSLSNGLELRIDRRAFDNEIDRAILDAVERVVPARRGRPPRRASTET